MSRPVWITQGGNLGTFPELEFYSLPLEVYEPTGAPVTFSFLSGQLPPGLQVIKTGKLQGVPVVTDPGPADETRTYKLLLVTFFRHRLFPKHNCSASSLTAL